jgi:single-stranded-DNA-specific exonuclease
MQKKHIKLLLKGGGRIFEGIGWGKSGWAPLLNPGGRVDAVYSLQFSEYMGERRLYLNLEDIRPAAGPSDRLS